MNVAVIILNWNGEKLLNEFLPKVIANTNPDVGRIIVADNGSDDNSRVLLAEKFPQVETILFDKNYGFAEGYNRAIAATDSKYIVLLNSDVAPAKGWLEPLVRLMDSDQNIGACQPKILSYREPEKFEYAGACGGFLDKNGYPYCRGRIFSDCEYDHGQYDESREIFWASGAALMVRKELYTRAGGLDPKFFAHMEEIDLCWRILSMGFRIMVEPAGKVYHLGGGSLPASNPRKTYLNFRNNLLMLHKNLPDGKRGFKLFWRRMLDTVAWAKFIISADWKNAAAIFRAHRDFSRMRRDYTSHPDNDLLATRTDTRTNILIQYFLLGRKTFSAIK